MAPLLASFVTIALVAGHITSATVIPGVGHLPQLPRAVNESRTCNATYIRKPWDWLTDQEQNDYLQAELCLMNTPSQLRGYVPGIVSRYDDLQHVHLAQADYIHFVGAFLPWHRYYIAVHQRLLRDECGYTGSMPYWAESYAESIGISNSSVFTASAFGSNGLNSTVTSASSSSSTSQANCTVPTDISIKNKRQFSGGDGCIGSGINDNSDGGCLYDGAFANVTLHLTTNQSAPEDYCITRNFDQSQFSSSSQAQVDTCLNYTDFADMWNCLESNPHRSGHAAIGGLMTNVALSPGDPIFWLHHTWLDSNWWSWQLKNLSYSLTAIGGSNSPSLGGLAGSSDAESAAFLDYDGDSSNVTTLNHTLWMVAVSENLTAGDVMDVRQWPSCAEYLFPDANGDIPS